MLDRIDERDKQERMHRSIVKYWNVSYIPTPYAEPKEEQTEEKEDAVTGQQLPVEPELTVSSANYGNEEAVSYTHLDVYKRQDSMRSVPAGCSARDSGRACRSSVLSRRRRTI